MMPEAMLPSDLSSVADDLRARQEPFAFATIVRTAGATAAKPGTKAILGADGDILQGWLGGGCTQSAVKRVAQRVLQDGIPQLISITPEELLSKKGVSAGDEVEGIQFERNGCPSEGTVDIFIEPFLPLPELVIVGASPVAQALADLAANFQWDVTRVGAEATFVKEETGRRRMVVVATQGQGDFSALMNALEAKPESVSFVGSRKKFAALAKKLTANGLAAEAANAVRAPAGLDIGAVTPEEIALSILAELTLLRRAQQEKGRHA